jgi:hypothetical protein
MRIGREEIDEATIEFLHRHAPIITPERLPPLKRRSTTFATGPQD